MRLRMQMHGVHGERQRRQPIEEHEWGLQNKLHKLSPSFWALYLLLACLTLTVISADIARLHSAEHILRIVKAT